MKRTSNELSLKDAINELLKEYRLTDKLNEVRLIGSWEKVMGSMISKRTDKLYIRGKTLFLKLNSAPLREELFYSKEKIIKLMNEEVGSVVIDDVVFA